MKLTRRSVAQGLLLAGVVGCAPEGETVLSADAGPSAACQAAEDALVDGLQSGQEVIDAFGCINEDGRFDPLADLLIVMQAETAPNGRPLLDLWVEAINQELTNAEFSPGTVALTPAMLAEPVADLLAFVQSGAPEVALQLTAEAVETGVATSGAQLLQGLAAQLAALGDPASGDALQTWMTSVQALLCSPYTSTADSCRSSLQQALAGLKATAEPSVWDPADPANDDLRETLAFVLTGGGRTNRAKEANEGVAAALAAMSRPVTFNGVTHDPPLQTALTELMAGLIGDDLSTPWAYEGYSGHDPGQSALYGVMLTLRDPAIQEALTAGADETAELVLNYYPGDPSQRGATTSYLASSCKTPEEAPETWGNAHNGVEQIVRLLSATNVPYTSSDACTFLFAPLLILTSPYLDFSGSTSVASFILESAAVLPLPLLQIGADLLNTTLVTTILNESCQVNLQYDDTEVLQAAVYFPYTSQYSLPLVAALNRTGDVDTLVNYLDMLWRTDALCELGPILRLIFDPNAPAGDGEPGDLDDILPDPSAPPGTTWNEQVLEPLLHVLMDVAHQSPTLMPPLFAMLQENPEVLTALLTQLGQMASNPDSALNEVGLMAASLSQLGGDPTAVNLAPAADALDRADLAWLVALTFRSDGVIAALTTGVEPADTGLLELLAETIRAGTTTNLLAMLEGLLLGLDEELSSSSEP